MHKNSYIYNTQRVDQEKEFILTPHIQYSRCTSAHAAVYITQLKSYTVLPRNNPATRAQSLRGGCSSSRENRRVCSLRKLF